MKSEFQKIRLTKKILFYFHDTIDLQDGELRMALRYLFTELYPLPVFFAEEYQDTLSYLKDVVIENNLKKIEDLNLYYESLLFDAQADLDKFKNSNDKLDQQGDIAMQVTDVSKHYSEEDIKDDVCRLQHLSWTPLTYLRSTENIFHKKMHSHLHCCSFEQKFPMQSIEHLYPTGSRQMFTRIHVNHFVNLDGYRNFYIRNNKAYKGIESIDIDNWRTSPFGEHCRNRVNYNLFANTLEKDYNSLVKQISLEEPISNDYIKIRLIRLLFSFKLPKTSELTCYLLTEKSFAATKFNSLKLTKQSLLYKCLFKITEQYYKNQFTGRRWYILKSPDGFSWLTTEDPGFSISLDAFASLTEELHPNTSLSDFAESSVIYFPLSKEYCLRIQPGNDIRDFVENDLPIVFKQSSEVEFQTINKMVMSLKKDVIISADKQTLKQFEEQVYGDNDLYCTFP